MISVVEFELFCQVGHPGSRLLLSIKIVVKLPCIMYVKSGSFIDVNGWDN